MQHSYVKYTLNEVLSIRSLVTIHYLNNISNYSTESETHDFWELVFIDSGSVIINEATHEFALSSNNVVFHCPGERHSFSIGSKGATLFIISFVCNDDIMGHFVKKIFEINHVQKKYISSIIEEAQQAFILNQDELLLRDLHPNPESSVGAGQLIRTYLEQLLISLLRIELYKNQKKSPIMVSTNQTAEYIKNVIIEYLSNNLSNNVGVDEIASYLKYCRSYISRLFKDATGYSIIQYYNLMRIKEAKNLLHRSFYTVSEIAEILGFQNIHYFSRVFKQIVGKSPKIYKDSLEYNFDE